MEILDIDRLLSLDLRTRILSRNQDGKKVKLGVSASLCFQELVLAKGAVLSQDSLLNIGWRQVGIEVTSSSLRVTINQLRRALLSLQVDKDLMIVTVPRAGYRLVSFTSNAADVTNEHLTDNAASEPDSQSSLALAEIKADGAKQPLLKFPTKHAIIIVSLSFFMGILIAWSISISVKNFATAVNYEQYDVEDIVKLPGSRVYVDSKHPPTETQISKTLSLWSRYAGEEKNRQYIYINGSHSSDYTSLFACTNALGEKQSECSSVVFRTH
jgi:DNA-binding winged helix-turn-helix (wHTH) protein